MAKESFTDNKRVRDLIKLMTDHGLTELELVEDKAKIRLARMSTVAAPTAAAGTAAEMTVAAPAPTGPVGISLLRRILALSSTNSNSVTLWSVINLIKSRTRLLSVKLSLAIFHVSVCYFYLGIRRAQPPPAASQPRRADIVGQGA